MIFVAFGDFGARDSNGLTEHRGAINDFLNKVSLRGKPGVVIKSELLESHVTTSSSIFGPFYFTYECTLILPSVFYTAKKALAAESFF